MQVSILSTTTDIGEEGIYYQKMGHNGSFVWLWDKWFFIFASYFSFTADKQMANAYLWVGLASLQVIFNQLQQITALQQI